MHTAQYHEPPETKVHAQKAVFGFDTQTSGGTEVPMPEELLGEYILQGSTIDKDAGTAVEGAGQSEAVLPFDFGDTEYDYGRL